MYKAHGFQVLKPPEAATVLASSARTPVEIFAVGRKVFCVQGHPEFTPALMRAMVPRLDGVVPAGELAGMTAELLPTVTAPCLTVGSSQAIRLVAREVLAGGAPSVRLSTRL